MYEHNFSSFRLPNSWRFFWMFCRQIWTIFRYSVKIWKKLFFSGNLQFTYCKYCGNFRIPTFWQSLAFWRIEQYLGHKIYLRHYMTTRVCAFESPGAIQPSIYLEGVTSIPKKTFTVHLKLEHFLKTISSSQLIQQNFRYM